MPYQTSLLFAKLEVLAEVISNLTSMQNHLVLDGMLEFSLDNACVQVTTQSRRTAIPWGELL
jgi:hypothetical protein